MRHAGSWKNYSRKATAQHQIPTKPAKRIPLLFQYQLFGGFSMVLMSHIAADRRELPQNAA
jgi:hypothetical protein